MMPPLSATFSFGDPNTVQPVKHAQNLLLVDKQGQLTNGFVPVQMKANRPI